MMKRVMHVACFSSFFLREKPSSIHIEEAMNSFSSLLQDIKNLESSLTKNSLSLRWCSEATNLLRKMHFQFLHIFQESEVPMFWDGGKYVDEYMRYSLHILDFCNVMRLAHSTMDRYCLLVDVAVKNISDEGNSGSAVNMTEIEKLEREWLKLYGIENWKNVNLYKTGRWKTKTKDNIFRAAHVVRRTMNIVCLLLFCAIFYPVSIEVDEEVYRDFPQLKLFSSSLRKLVCCFFEERQGVKDNSRPVLAETKMVESAVEELRGEILNGGVPLNKEKLRKTIDSLQNSSLALKEGLGIFDSAVNELFQDVMKGRNMILGLVASS
ncbi:hypothetical protein SADUNF_Sadunf13G0090700 [Salix dunnii]|uniref:BPS1-like protein n=1 Tax=Salix dunnii TaxID=1413687 RepID=A0A835JI14_9ROSI|nr:hypothetical protein SADUNF_Sadunf13G0090700 [Salix dunnii]